MAFFQNWTSTINVNYPETRNKNRNQMFLINSIHASSGYKLINFMEMLKFWFHCHLMPVHNTLKTFTFVYLVGLNVEDHIPSSAEFQFERLIVQFSSEWDGICILDTSDSSTTQLYICACVYDLNMRWIIDGQNSLCATVFDECKLTSNQMCLVVTP